MSAAFASTDGPAWRGAVFSWWRGRKIAAALISAAIAAFVLLPLLSLVRIAAVGDPEIWPHLAAHVIPYASLQTILLLAGVAAVTTGAGVGAAWLVTAFRFPGRDALLWLLPLPLAIPTYIAAYIYVDIFDTAGPVQTALRSLFGWRTASEYWFPPVRSLGGAILIFSFVLYPYVYLAARAMFQTQCAVFIDAARVLGAGPWRLWCDIVLPLARPALAVGISLALIETLNDIGASEYLGVQTLTLSVFTTWLNRGSLPGAAQIALAMLVLVTALIAFERYGRRHQSYQAAMQDGRILAPIVLRGGRAWAAAIACALPVTVGFLGPAGYLGMEAVRRGLVHGFDPALAVHGLSTVALAACATAAVLALGITGPVLQRLAPGRFVQSCIMVGTLGYAVPGTVLALGLLAPLVAVDNAINWVSMRVAGVPVGLLLAGSGAAVVIAYTTRFLAISIGLVQAGFARIAMELDEAARLSGARTLTLVRSVHLPLVRPALWGAALLVFVDCLKELPMTLLLRPLNVETLATYIYQFATRGDFEEGSLAALLIVAAGIFPVMHIVRLAERTPGAQLPLE